MILLLIVFLTLVHGNVFVLVKCILIRHVLLLYPPKYSRILLASICCLSQLYYICKCDEQRLLDLDLNHGLKS